MNSTNRKAGPIIEEHDGTLSGCALDSTTYVNFEIIRE